MVNPQRFHEWLISARPGDSITYYHGHLAVDRGALCTIPAPPRTPALDDADAALDASDAGLVTLTQRAIGSRASNGIHSAFAYIAQRTAGSAKRVAPAPPTR